MMNHLTEERLVELADSGGTDEHLAHCAECRAAVDEQRAARAALQAAPLLELPRERVRAIVAELPEQTPVRRLRGWPQRLAILAPVAAAAVAIAVVGRGTSETPVAQEAAGGDRAAALTAPATADADAQVESREAAPQLEGEPAQATPPADGGELRGWTLVFASRADAEAAASDLRGEGFLTAVAPAGDEWAVEASRVVVPGSGQGFGAVVADAAADHDGRIEGMFAPASEGSAP